MSHEKVVIHGREYKLKHATVSVDHCVRFGPWAHRSFSASDCWGLRDGEGFIHAVTKGPEKPPDFFLGSSASDVDQAEVSSWQWARMPGGLDHSHCTICRWTLHDSEDMEKSTGWHCKSSHLWVCNECYEKLLKPRLAEKDA